MNCNNSTELRNDQVHVYLAPSLEKYVTLYRSPSKFPVNYFQHVLQVMYIHINMYMLQNNSLKKSIMINFMHL